MMEAEGLLIAPAMSVQDDLCRQGQTELCDDSLDWVLAYSYEGFPRLESL
jgi:hypothetical protein